MTVVFGRSLSPSLVCGRWPWFVSGGGGSSSFLGGGVRLLSLAGGRRR